MTMAQFDFSIMRKRTEGTSVLIVPGEQSLTEGGQMARPRDGATDRSLESLEIAISCERQRELTIHVHHHLIRISELSRAAADAVVNRYENLARELDVQLEDELGAKERALGALQEHRKEHGC